MHTYHGHVFHSYYGRVKTRLFLGIERLLARLATDRIVVVSTLQLREINETFRVGQRKQFAVIPLGIDTNAFADWQERRPRLRAELKVSDSELLVGIVGRLTEVKNHALFLRAAAACRALVKTRRVRFVIIGDGKLRSALEAEAKSLLPVDDVVFLGTRNDPENFYPALDIVALTSLNEGTPLTLIEAMANARPVIATEVGGVVDLLGPTVSAGNAEPSYAICERGLLAKSGDAEGVARGLVRLIEDESLRIDLGLKGRDFVLRNYAKERLLADMTQLYSQLIATDPAASEGATAGAEPAAGDYRAVWSLRVLITGGAGFIGSHLSDAYLERGDEVFIVDDLSTGSFGNIQHLKDHPRFHYKIDSVHNRPVTAELVDQCDVIFHLAAAVGVKLIVESPVRTIETNVHGTEVVLSLASKKKKKVLVASTSEVYGLSTEVPFREDGNLVMGATTKGRWSYACSKAIDEFLALAYWREKKLPTVIVRLFNTVGPRQTGQYGMVIPTFVKQALSGRPITVYGSGEQSRCFCYVGDVVGALMKLMDHESAVGEVFNVGSNQEITILDLARKVKELTNSKSEITFVPYDEAYEEGFEDMPRRIPDISKVNGRVGFQPEKSLDGILDSVIEFHSEQMSVGRG